MGSDLFNSSLHIVLHFASPCWCAEKMKKNKNVFHQFQKKLIIDSSLLATGCLRCFQETCVSRDR